jgi:hypothetical protein
MWSTGRLDRIGPAVPGSWRGHPGTWSAYRDSRIGRAWHRLRVRPVS